MTTASGANVDLAALTALPKAELHLHIEGTLEPELILELAARNGITLPFPTLELLREQYEFSDLQSFLNLYYANMAVLVTESDFAAMTRAYLRRAQECGVRHAEIMFDPQAHMARGVELSTAVNGIAVALASSEADFGITTELIAAFLRDQSQDSALEVLEALLSMGAPIIGIGLDSAEVGNPPSKFIDLYRRAKEAGLRLVAHAGEEGPPSYVEDALNLLGVERIDHGIRAVEDKFLIKRLVAEQVPLTVCPLSNVRLRAVDTLAAHPLPQMITAGLNVCINSDDPAYFGGYVGANFAALVTEFQWDAATVELLAENSIRSSFASESRKDELLGELANWGAGQR